MEENQKRRQNLVDTTNDLATRLIFFVTSRTINPLSGLGPIVLTVFGAILFFAFLILITGGGVGIGIPGGPGATPTPAPIAGTPISITRGLTDANGMTLEQIADVLKKTPLRGLEEVIAEAAQRYKINPALVLAIGMHESGLGESYEGKRLNAVSFNDHYHNSWGILNTGRDGYGNSHHAFPSWEQGIARETGVKGIFPLLRTFYFDQRGARSIADIKTVYAPDGASNDPYNLNSSWLRRVTEFYNRFYQNRQLAIGACEAIGIPKHAAEIADRLELGCGEHYNRSPDYPELYNPTTCGTGGGPTELFWCSWLVVKSFDRSSIKLPLDWLSAVRMETAFRERGWFMPSNVDVTTLEPGDVLFMNNNRQHVGVVYLVTDKYIVSKESNSSQRSWRYEVKNDVIQNEFVSGFGRHPCGSPQ